MASAFSPADTSTGGERDVDHRNSSPGAAGGQNERHDKLLRRRARQLSEATGLRQGRATPTGQCAWPAHTSHLFSLRLRVPGRNKNKQAALAFEGPDD